MNNQLLKKIISQLRKYELTTAFKNNEELDNWIKKLTSKAVENFINLHINLEEIKFPKELLINENLLNCDDYNKRIMAMSKLKNGEGCWHLFERLCSPNFLNSKYYYQDLALISAAPTARYPLWIINNDNFLNSKYHTEDLVMIIESLNPESNNDILVAESLAEVAGNKDSINSEYHRQDMDIILKSRGDCLQLYGSYPKKSLNNLAVNPISLQDPYHLENMQILSQSPLASEFIYQLMTNKKIINGKHYREEINALIDAKSIVTAIVIFNYIMNPQDNNYLDFTTFDLYDFDINDESHQTLNYCYRYLGRKNNQPSNLNPEYLKYLMMFNDIDDKILPYFELLLSNKHLFNSQYYEKDLALFLKVTNQSICHDLYQLMTNNLSLNSPYHLNDAFLISQTENERNRKLLLNKATSEESLASQHHEHDMQYISKLNLSKIKPRIYERMAYYLFNPQGLNAKEHLEALKTLVKGEMYEPVVLLDEYLNSHDDRLLLEESDFEEYTPTIEHPKAKFLTRIKKIFIPKK